MQLPRWLTKCWNFLWHDDSVASWLANVAVAFIVIKYLFYPTLGFLFGTQFPVVAVVSGSMEHDITPKYENRFGTRTWTGEYGICGETFPEPRDLTFDEYWELCGDWYERRGIEQAEFQQFPFPNGFDKGDIMVLVGHKGADRGDIIVYRANKAYPIIHRVVGKQTVDFQTFYATKGDHNADQLDDPDETRVPEQRVLGKAAVRIPYLGYVKIWFVNTVSAILQFL